MSHDLGTTDDVNWCPTCGHPRIETREIGCIYCGLKMNLDEDGASGKMADHIWTCQKSPIVEAYAKLQSDSSDTLDLFLDEFERIRVLVSNGKPTAEEAEIAGICDRAASQIKQIVPVIEQRDAMRKERDEWRARAEELEGRIANALI